MMAKITSGRCFKGVINYIMDDKKDARLLATAGVRFISKEDIIHSFIRQSSLKPNRKVCVGHISLNFPEQDKDNIPDEKMVKIAEEYLKDMEISNTQFIIVRHFDKPHPHIHICFNRVKNDGGIVKGNNERFRSKNICRKLTGKYGLYISSGKENVKMDRLKEPDKTRYEIYHTLNSLVPHCRNWQQLISGLQRAGINTGFKTKGNSNEVQGVRFEKNGYSFNGSKVDKMFSYSKIDSLLRQNEFANKQEQSQRQSSSNSPESHSKGIIESTLGALSGMSLFQPHGDDYQDEAFRNRLDAEERKRKKKNKFRRGLY